MPPNDPIAERTLTSFPLFLKVGYGYTFKWASQKTASHFKRVKSCKLGLVDFHPFCLFPFFKIHRLLSLLWLAAANNVIATWVLNFSGYCLINSKPAQLFPTPRLPRHLSGVFSLLLSHGGAFAKEGQPGGGALGLTSTQPHTLIIHTSFDSILIKCLYEILWEQCMHNKCMGLCGNLTGNQGCK